MAVTSTLGKPGVIAGKLPPLVKGFYLQFALVLVFLLSIVANGARIWPDRTFGHKVVGLVILGFFLTLACRMAADSRAWNNGRYLALSTVATALLAIPLFSGNTIDFSMDYPTLPLLCVCIALVILTAPFLGRDHTNEAVWEYNRATLSGVTSGLAITVLLAAGLLGAIFATDLGTGIPASFLAIPYAIFMSFIVIWQLLAGMPRQFDATPADPAPKWLPRLTNTVIVPVVAVGFVALLLYLVGLLASAELPPSEIGWMISGFAILVVAAHFVSWPLRDTGGRAVRLFHKHYKYTLPGTAIVLALDAGMRISESGLTEGRYLMLMLAFWLFATAVYHALPTQRRLVMAPALLAALLFGVSFGPWGATGLSTRSQLSRLENQLITYELLVEGKIVPAEAFIETEKMKNITATLEFFEGRDKENVLEAWFANHGLEREYDFYAFARSIMKSMGLQAIYGWQRPSFEFNSRLRYNLIDVEGFSYIGIVTDHYLQLTDAGKYSSRKGEFIALSGTKFEIGFGENSDTFLVRSDGDEQIVFDIAAVAQGLKRENNGWSGDSEGQPVVLNGTSKSGLLTARLYIRSISGDVVDGAPEVQYLDATILLRENPTPR